MTPAEWQSKVAAAEAAGVMHHGQMVFLPTDHPLPAGRSGRVWADAGGHGYWLAGRRGMELLEMRLR